MYRSSRRRLLKGLALSGAIASLPPTAGATGPQPARSQSAVEPEVGVDWFVDPDDGNDDWAGHQPEPGEGDAGPLETIEAAVDRAYSEAADLQENDADRTTVRIWLRGGRYLREEPIRMRRHGTDRSITVAAYPDETPIVDGSRELTGWTETTVNGVTAWQTSVPGDVPYFRTLFVDDERRPRPRLPAAVDEVFEDGARVTDDEERFYHFQGAPDERGAKTFTAESGSIDPDWRNLQDVNVIAINKWYDERSTIDSIEGQEVTLEHRPYPGKDWPERFYYVENVFEALAKPGQWYLDREAGECYYVPREDESIEDVAIRVPRTRQLLGVGSESGEDPVRDVTIRGVTFGYSAWEHLQDVPGTTQAAFPAWPTVFFRRAEHCALEGCTIQSPGEYGIGLELDAAFIDIVGCEITDMGAGGVKVFGSHSNDRMSTGKHRIADCHIHDGGQVFHMGAGVLSTGAPWMTIAHNHIHDLYYTSISVGFAWGFGGIADYNQVEYNHLHHLGQGLLSDMGGVYTLGKQPGTEVRHNYIHHIFENDYGAWGLYPDQGTAGVLWAENLVHTVLNGFHLHFGGDNRVHNNILADNRGAAIARSNSKTGGYEYGLRAHNNVLTTDATPIFGGGYDWSIDQGGVQSDRNVLWNRAGVIDASELGTGSLKLVRADDDSDLPGAEVTIDFSHEQLGSFQYGELEEAVTLEANTRYRLVMEVTSGGPQWYKPVSVTATDAAAVVGSTQYSEGDEAYRDNSDGRSYGPVNLRYRIDGGETRALVTEHGTDADLRTYSGRRGTTLEIGDEPIEVTALGRYLPEGSGKNDWWETWQEMGRDTNSVIADPQFVDPANDDYTLQEDSPAFEDPVNFQALDLSTVGPREETPLARPTGVEASLDGETATLEWDEMPQATGYRIARSTVDGYEFSVIAEQRETTFVDEGLDPDSGPYYYTVTALGTDGEESAASAQASVAVREPTPTPTATATPTPTASATPTETPTDTDGDGPGFGVLAALAAAGLTSWRLLGEADRPEE